MHIEELTRDASLHFLAGSRLGRLACAKQSQPYVTPFYFVYHDQWIYSFSTIGQKIEWLRANPLACVEVDEIASPQEWTSVGIFGRYEELAKTTDGQSHRKILIGRQEEPTKSDDDQNARDLAFKLLQQRQLWWEPGYSRTVLHGTPRPLEPVYFRLSVDEISGHRATLEQIQSISSTINRCAERTHSWPRGPHCFHKHEASLSTNHRWHWLGAKLI